ncbi:acyl-CoA N-acyltransferase [Cylindrobasidium torrendii FP15055 ss-10]|uniref:N-alpha-acetyltransferase 40 n=1 Tax=Cylindrobasidium torrendii FP15055 ss-10 TaxID=1314674 RepID=A0A0D7BRE8_9AGAR|nr:acyl-CoA N-acyltransferase [Cylindrobasidium torrendii FP15055 ss-10]
MALHSGSLRVRRANTATSTTLQTHLNASQSPNLRFGVYRASELSEDRKRTMFSLLEAGVKDRLAASSMGWDETEKWEEVFSPLSRYILVVATENENLAAFCHFRFEHEDEWDILYCYEVHVHQAWRRRGLGRALLNQLVAVGEAQKMKRLLLTVLNSNPEAHALYQGFGFKMDEDTPEDADYEIMRYDLERR